MSGISIHAKVLYGLLLDRMSLSAVVKARLLKLDGDHLRSVLMCHKVTHKKLTSDSPTILSYLYGSRPIHITGLIFP